MKPTSNHGCDHPCDEQSMHEICMDHSPVAFQDQYDDYVKQTHAILNNPDHPVDFFVESTLRLGLSIMEYYRYNMQELDFYRKKFTKIRPREMEMSQLKKCHIGKCECGQLLLESRDKCCPKCCQFIDWTPAPAELLPPTE